MSRAKQDRIHGHLAMTGLINLSAALPLAAPLSLQIDVSSACPFRCPMCPTSNPKKLIAAGRPPTVMSLNNFTKLIDDLGDFPGHVKTIMLYKMGEPVANRQLGTMVRYAKDATPETRLEVTTNAALLTRDRSRELIDAGLDYIRISVEHVHDEGYRKVTGNFSNYQAILDNARALWDQRERMGKKTPHIFAKIIDVGLTESERETFENDWRDISDTRAIHALFQWPNDPGTTLGTTPTTGIDGVTPIKLDRVVCASPFKGMSIDADLLVTACCVDALGETAIGDARTESLESIWNGHVLKQFRLMHLRGERNQNKACASCSYVLGQHPESELDGARERLLPLYQ